MTEPQVAPAGEWRTAVISDVHHPNPRTVMIRLDVPGRTRQLPGQHYVVRLTADDGYTASRSYSVCSAPSDPLLEMLIEKLDGGEVSGYFADVAEPGDLVEVRGPIGRWFVWNGHRPALAIGGGTGVAPIVAMLRHAREIGATDLFTPVVAARTMADLPFADEFVAAGATIVLSQQDFRARKAGRLSAADLKPLMAQGQTSYVCGSAGFAESASQLLVALGVDVGSVRVERFGAAGGDRRGFTQPVSSVVIEPTNVHPGVMTFRDLHAGELPLVLPNAWDVASALAFLDAGFPAIGTTSFGVAAACGYPDGGRSTRDQTRALAGLLSVLPCYISVDVEDGYDDDPGRVAEYVASLGVDGINIEDSSAGRLIRPELHAAKVAAIKERCPRLYVNARVDTYWLGEDATVSATLPRAAAYVGAGADGIFVPGAADPAELQELTSQIPVPVNVLVLPGVSLPELASWGVRRVSTGSLPYRAAIDSAVRVATSVRDGRGVPQATRYSEMQQRLVGFQALNTQ